jgi:hypothetical protein
MAASPPIEAPTQGHRCALLPDHRPYISREHLERRRLTGALSVAAQIEEDGAHASTFQRRRDRFPDGAPLAARVQQEDGRSPTGDGAPQDGVPADQLDCSHAASFVRPLP